MGGGVKKEKANLLNVRIGAFACSLFGLLHRILNEFLHRHPSYEIFNHSRATLLRLFQRFRLDHLFLTLCLRFSYSL